LQINREIILFLFVLSINTTTFQLDKNTHFDTLLGMKDIVVVVLVVDCMLRRFERWAQNIWVQKQFVVGIFGHRMKHFVQRRLERVMGREKKLAVGMGKVHCYVCWYRGVVCSGNN